MLLDAWVPQDKLQLQLLASSVISKQMVRHQPLIVLGSNPSPDRVPKRFSSHLWTCFVPPGEQSMKLLRDEACWLLSSSSQKELLRLKNSLQIKWRSLY